MKKYRYLFSVLLITVLVAVLVFINDERQEYHGTGNEILLTDGWKITINEETWEQVEIDEFRFSMTQRGDVLILERMLPRELCAQPILRFYHAHSDLQIYVNAEQIYSYGSEDYDAGRVVGYGYHFVPLSADMAGDLLRIELRVSEANAFSTLELPIIADSVSALRSFVAERRIELACILFLIVFGIVLLAITAFYALKKQMFYRLVYIGLFSIAVGFWSLCNYDLITIFTFQPKMKAIAEYGALYLAPGFLFGYFGSEVKKQKNERWYWCYVAIWAVQWIFVGVSFTLQALNVVHFQSLLSINHVIMLIMSVYLFIVIISAIKNKKTENKVMLYGIMLVIFFMLADMLRFNLQRYAGFMPNVRFRSMIYLGIFLFIITMLVDYCLDIMRVLYDTARHETLEKLAYTDYLTGLENRRRCEDIYDRMDATGAGYAVINMDLNELKRVNDQLGHKEGDRYLQAFAEILKEAFNGSAGIARTGGDEFEVILENPKQNEVEERLALMEQRIMQTNQKEEHWRMSVSYGVCRDSEPGMKSIREAHRLADERMYVQKFERRKRLEKERVLK